jgi:deoxyribodipyrimidine photo-lyase
MTPSIYLFWFRRDLRLEDNHGLYQALKSGKEVQPFFIFDSEILDELEDKSDARVNFIFEQLNRLQEELTAWCATLDVRYGRPLEVIEQLLNDYSVDTVFANHDYEPYATERDQQILLLLKNKGISFRTFKDQVIFEKNEVVKDDGSAYSVFTPFSRKWRSLLTTETTTSFPALKYLSRFFKQTPRSIPGLEQIGFELNQTNLKAIVAEDIIRDYKATRDFPAVSGTSRLGIHLRFGTISIRQLVHRVVPLSETFLGELIWREFFSQLLWRQPRLVHECCRPEYEHIQWRNNPVEFERWCEGRTGYPLVDAGMRELNATGFMHNRVRMVTASFLVKHLLIDWRWGEAYFARKLMDFELASNNGNWQWVAGCGCDAAPYFRIFNPSAQVKCFDPELIYIRKWIPELNSFSYPAPMVVHEVARDRCLKTYKEAVSKVERERR